MLREDDLTGFFFPARRTNGSEELHDQRKTSKQMHTQGEPLLHVRRNPMNRDVKLEPLTVDVKYLGF
jgi:hypothetical protein